MHIDLLKYKGLLLVVVQSNLREQHQQELTRKTFYEKGENSNYELVMC